MSHPSDEKSSAGTNVSTMSSQLENMLNDQHTAPQPMKVQAAPQHQTLLGQQQRSRGFSPSL